MRTPSRRSMIAVLASFLLLAPVALAASPAVAVPSPSVVINEVESNGDATDWVEFKNTGTADVDLTGYIVRDSEQGTPYVFPAGSVIAPDGYLVVVPGTGLGGSDSVRLLEADDTTVVLTYAWGSHASTTYGRCPDGTGELVTTFASSKGATNVCALDPATVVRLNEVESNGDATDWIELKNTGTSTVDVSGLVVKDNADLTPYTIPSGTTIAAGGHLVVEPTYGLSGADSARLLKADGTTVIDSYTWTAHASTTYGRCPDGTGAFATTTSSTKGATNDCAAPSVGAVRINEVESSGGTPGDWVELVNAGSTSVDISGWRFKDNDDSRTVSIPSGTVIAAGGYYVLEESFFIFGLGVPDSARLYLADGVTLVDSRSWTAHATTTYGVCGTEFVTTTSPTKGAVNDCTPPVRINEVESNGDSTDWIELKNNGSASVELAGFVLKDNSNNDSYTFASGASIAAGGYLVVDPAFGLGGGDSARLFAADGTTLIDSYTWTAHAGTTYGRCPDGTGEFATTSSSTRGAVNACAGDLVTSPWPGAASITTVDRAADFATNMSGLAYEGDIVWAVSNSGILYRLLQQGSTSVPDSTNGWTAGKLLHYPTGLGTVDSEGIALTSAGAAGGVFVASERDGAASSVSRLSVLRYDVSGTSTELTATREWNLTAALPVVGSNTGLEAVAWVPDSYLVAGGFRDGSTGAAYNPALYAGHGSGLFFVGVEGTGDVHAFALDQTSNAFTLIATIDSGFALVADLEFDAERGALWVVCDDTCQGRSATFTIASNGAFQPTAYFERPAGMPNLNNEGFAIAPQQQCVAGSKTVLWADDGDTGGFSLRSGTITCTVLPTTGPTPTTPVAVPEGSLTEGARGPVTAPSTAQQGETIRVFVGVSHAGETVDVWIYSTPTYLGKAVVGPTGYVTVTVPSSLPAGAHRIAVLDASGALIGWANVSVTASGLAYTGLQVAGPLWSAVLLLLLGGVLLTVRRRTRGAHTA